MDNYTTEEEQLEALKRWWKENGQSLLLGIAIALGGFFSWQAWDGHKAGQLEQASALYQELLTADGQIDTTEQQLATAKHLSAQLKEEFSGSPYAMLAGLFSAKYAANDADWETAETELEWVLDQKPPAAMALQARLRLAQVQLEQSQYDKALSSLAVSDALAYAGRFAELRGDIHWAKGDAASALDAFNTARALYLTAPRSGGDAVLAQKIQALEVQLAAAVSSDAVEPSSDDAAEES